MIDEAALREGLKKLLATTEADIRAGIEEEPSLKHALEARHKAAAEAGRAAPGAWLASATKWQLKPLPTGCWAACSCGSWKTMISSMRSGFPARRGTAATA